MNYAHRDGRQCMPSHKSVWSCATDKPQCRRGIEQPQRSWENRQVLQQVGHVVPDSLFWTVLLRTIKRARKPHFYTAGPRREQSRSLVISGIGRKRRHHNVTFHDLVWLL